MPYYICPKCGAKFTGWADNKICQKCGSRLKEISKSEFYEEKKEEK